VLALGIGLLGMGLAINLALTVVGAVVFVAGLAGWIYQLLPGKGHAHEPLAGPEGRPRQVSAIPGTVEQLRAGVPGYRFRLPEKVHPISAGVKGGIVGGLVMPIPALAYGVFSGNGIWFPINLLAGTVLPAVDSMGEPELRQFSMVLLIVSSVIHAVFSVSFGLIYGVVLPTLPPIKGGPIIWGGVLMPLLWTGLSYGLMGIVNPALDQHVDWRWFLVSQLVYGLVMATVVYRSEKIHIPPAGRGPEPLAEYVAGSDEGQS
jgi:hypothetical protein